MGLIGLFLTAEGEGVGFVIRVGKLVRCPHQAPGDIPHSVVSQGGARRCGASPSLLGQARPRLAAAGRPALRGGQPLLQVLAHLTQSAQVPHG